MDNSFKNITVLLTGAGAPGAPGIIKCLRNNRERKIRIIGVDMNADASGKTLVDKFYPVPPASSEDFIPAVLDICKREKVDGVIPIITKELCKFADNKNLFEEIGVAVAIDSKSLRIVNNKLSLLRFLKEHELPVSKFYPANTVDEIIEGCWKLGYPQKPVCVKAAFGNGSRGIRIIDPAKSKYELFFNEKPNSMYISFDELTAALREKDSIPEMLVMEYLPGEEYSVDAMADNGKILYMIGRYNTIVQSSIPLESRLFRDESAYRQCEEIIRLLHWHGNIGFDFKKDSEGFPKLMEINPRLTATIVLNAAAGVNLPYLCIKQLLGETLPRCTVNYNVVMTRRYEEVFTDGNENGKIINFG